MSETPTTKQELLDLLRKEETALETIWEQAGEARVEQPGVMGDWTFKDLIAHLNAWRAWSIVRLDAARAGGEPAALWPSDIDSEDVDAVNNWFYQQHKNKPPQQVLTESRESFEQLKQGLQALSDADLFTPDRFTWMKGKTLGPKVVSSSVDHFYDDHEDNVRDWLSHLV